MRRIAAWGLSAALAFGAGACGGGERGPVEEVTTGTIYGPEEVPRGIVATDTNPSGFELPVKVGMTGNHVVLLNPDQVGPDAMHHITYAGIVNLGYQAIATCYYDSEDMDDQIFTQGEGDNPDGFMFVLARDSSKDMTPEQVFTTSDHELRRLLPDCVVERVGPAKPGF